MTYQGHVQNGVIVLDDSVTLPEGMPVQVRVLEPTSQRTEPPSSLFDRLRSVIGSAKGLPEDASVNHDHYLYGLPKK